MLIHWRFSGKNWISQRVKRKGTQCILSIGWVGQRWDLIRGLVKKRVVDPHRRWPQILKVKLCKCLSPYKHIAIIPAHRGYIQKIVFVGANELGGAHTDATHYNYYDDMKLNIIFHNFPLINKNLLFTF
jgi:hypothetical protein